MIEVLKPPTYHPLSLCKKGIFLAGSIEMGKAVDWQKEISSLLSFYIPEKIHNDFIIFNPRRDDWNNSWEQSIKNKKFREQVDWEKNHLKISHYKVFYFQPDTISPISLLELGKYGGVRTVVICPDGYFRKGNIDIFCENEGITQVESIQTAAYWLSEQLIINE